MPPHGEAQRRISCNAAAYRHRDRQRRRQPWHAQRIQREYGRFMCRNGNQPAGTAAYFPAIHWPHARRQMQQHASSWWVSPAWPASADLPGTSAYSASRAAAINYLEGRRMEMPQRGIHVTPIAAGCLRTPMTDINSYRMAFSWRRCCRSRDGTGPRPQTAFCGDPMADGLGSKTHTLSAARAVGPHHAERPA